jgi:hypothetical protein
MEAIAKSLDEKGYCLRSGGANGADTAFEKHSTNKEIFLPSKGFNGNTSELFEIKDEAFFMASQCHPAWFRCSTFARRLLARNMHQILGYDLKNSC